MNFELSKEQEMIVASVTSFVKEESPLERFRKLRDTGAGWDQGVWQQMGDYGWLGIAFPEDVGGIGGTFVDMALILEQLGRHLVPEPYIASVVLAGGLVDRLGSHDQRHAHLPSMIEGKASLAFAFSERQSRYNLSDCLTTATSTDPGGYRLDGEKLWVLNGEAADTLVVLARTAGEQLDEEGLSLFVVPGDAPGVSRTAIQGMDGHRTAHVELDGVELGADSLLGEAGGAITAVEWAVDRAAAAACAEGQGQLSELLSRTVEFLKEREQFGLKIGSFQALQHRAADMFAEVELCKGTMILAAIKADSEDPDVRAPEISAAKLQLSDGGWFVQENALQLHGGVGITDEQDVGLFFKRLRVLNSLFGDADYHVDRFQRSKAF